MDCPKCGKENREDARFCMDCGANLSGYKVEISPNITVSPKISVSTIDKEQISLLVENTLSKALEKPHNFKDIHAKDFSSEEQQAVSTLQKIAEEAGRGEEVGRRKGEVYFPNCNYDLQDLERCMKFLDGERGLWSVKGCILSALGKHSEALECWDKLLDINPLNGAWWFNKGLTLEELKRYNEAVSCFNKALDLNPEIDLAWAKKGNFIVRQLRELVRKFLEGKISVEEFKSKKSELDEEEAMRYFNKALEINPQLEWAWVLKSMIENDTNDAIKYLDTALDINPRSADALCMKGIVKVHSMEDILDDLLVRKDDSLFIKREKIPEYKSRLLEAIKFFDNALEIEPNLAEALKEKEELLEELRNLVTTQVSQKGGWT